MSRRLIPLALLLALVAGGSAVAQTPAEAVVLFTTIGGMAPRTTELAIRSDGTVLLGKTAKSTPCPYPPLPARLETLGAPHFGHSTSCSVPHPWRMPAGLTPTTSPSASCTAGARH